MTGKRYSADADVLELLGGELAPRQIAAGVGMAAPHVHRVLTRLMRRGLVEKVGRKPHTRYRLTEKGGRE